jgi:hypothetical protein
VKSYKMCMGGGEVTCGCNFDITATGEIYFVAVSVHFTSEGQISQPPTDIRVRIFLLQITSLVAALCSKYVVW